MDEEFTTAEAAKKLKRSVQAVKRAAVRLGLGKLINPRLRLLSAADLKKIKAHTYDGPGKPKKKGTR